MRHADFLVAACGLLSSSVHAGSSSLTRASPCPLHWEHGVLPTGPPGKSPGLAFFLLSNNSLEQGSPNPGLWTGTSAWHVRNRAAQQEVSGGGRVSKASSAAPHCSHYCLNQPPYNLWKNCLPRNWFLVPKRLGTAAVETHPSCCTYQ